MTPGSDDPLIAGYQRFRSAVWPAQAERYAHLARRRQQPATVVVACSDARIDPQTIFDAGPGDLFVIRNVAGLVPPVCARRTVPRHLRRPRICRPGLSRSARSSCWGTAAAAASMRPSIHDGALLSPGDFIGKWMGMIARAADAGPTLPMTAGRRTRYSSAARSAIRSPTQGLPCSPRQSSCLLGNVPELSTMSAAEPGAARSSRCRRFSRMGRRPRSDERPVGRPHGPPNGPHSRRTQHARRMARHRRR